MEITDKGLTFLTHNTFLPSDKKNINPSYFHKGQKEWGVAGTYDILSARKNYYYYF